MAAIFQNSTLAPDDNVVCFTPTMTATKGVWQGTNPFSFSIPLFMLQLLLIVVTTRGLALLLKPFHQPRAVAETLAGIILGPSVLGRSAAFSKFFFPPSSLLPFETIANLGLLFFLFLIGTEMDLDILRQSGQKAFVVATVGVVLPFAIGTTTVIIFENVFSGDMPDTAFLLFLGVTLSVTAIPVLASVLAEAKLLNSEIGRLSMAAAIINDAITWILLTMSITIAVPEGTILSSLWVFLATVAFVVFCCCCVRPALWWVMQKIPEGQVMSDVHVCIMLSFMMLAAVSADFIGIHSVFGAFVFGLVIPNGPIGVALIEKLEDFVTGMLLPLYVVLCGLGADFSKVVDGRNVALLIVVFVLASVGKLLATFVISVLYTMPLCDGLSLGFLMNTRGLLELVVLNIGKNKKMLRPQTFSVLLVTSLVVTAMVTPSVVYLQRPTRRFVGYKRRNLQRAKPDTELRVLACVHNTRNVPSIISILDMSSPSKRSPIFVYALHLVELAGRSSAMLIVHNQDNVHHHGRRNALAGTQAQSDHIFHAFENYEQRAGGVSVQTLTIVSPYTTMHEDVCSLAEDKHVTIIILPFHKQQTVDGGMEPINPAIKQLNENVIAVSPCSVGILVDRGLSSKGRAAHEQQQIYRIAQLFFGGPDDREALAYAWRVIEQPEIHLTVVRFLPGEEVTPPTSPASAQDIRIVNILTVNSEERHVDDQYVNEFRMCNTGNESLLYVEKVVKNTEETVAAIRSMGGDEFDLFVVGRSQGEGAAALTGALWEWTECPELGPIGDLLASSDFAMTASVIVVHQYVGGPLGNVATAAVAAAVSDSTEQPRQRRLSKLNPRASPAAGSRQRIRIPASATFN